MFDTSEEPGGHRPSSPSHCKQSVVNKTVTFTAHGYTAFSEFVVLSWIGEELELGIATGLVEASEMGVRVEPGFTS